MECIQNICMHISCKDGAISISEDPKPFVYQIGYVGKIDLTNLSIVTNTKLK